MGGSRRRIVSIAASTPGTGRNARLGMAIPKPNSHQGAQAALRRLVGGIVVLFAATSR